MVTCQKRNWGGGRNSFCFMQNPPRRKKQASNKQHAQVHPEPKRPSEWRHCRVLSCQPRGHQQAPHPGRDRRVAFLPEHPGPKPCVKISDLVFCSTRMKTSPVCLNVNVPAPLSPSAFFLLHSFSGSESP